MSTTIISVYDDPAQAFSAKNDLIASGFSPRNVQLNPDPGQAAHPVSQQGPVKTVIGNFLRSFLLGVGDKSSHSNLYAKAVRRGSSVLIVDTGDDQERERAEGIVQRHGPVDMEERSPAWGEWRGHNPDAR